MAEPQLPNIGADRKSLLLNTKAELKFLQNYLEYPSVSALGMLAETKVLDLGPEAVPFLKQALVNKLPESRAFAAKMLGLIGHKDSLHEIGKLLKDPNPKVVDTAIGSIGNLQVEDGVELIKPFLNSPDSVTQVTAVRALGNIRGQKSSTVLLQELKSKASSEVRSEFWRYRPRSGSFGVSGSGQGVAQNVF